MNNYSKHPIGQASDSTNELTFAEGTAVFHVDNSDHPGTPMGQRSGYDWNLPVTKEQLKVANDILLGRRKAKIVNPELPVSAHASRKTRSTLGL